MTFQGDPYRTLGIPQGASLNEIRSAYRRLVKQYHPDAAGERALPRFLAIQAAYERLVDGEGRLRSGRAGTGRRGGTSSGGEADPWRADPARARASRDAWRARRATGGAASGSGAGSGPGGAGAAGNGSGSSGTKATGSAGPGTRSTGSMAGSAGPRDRSEARGRAAGGTAGPRAGDRSGRRGPRKATPGSTTYDEAAEAPRDPEWDGGAWYGPSSGTYWTLNPREYADPRKHGPEYLARARRAAQAGEAAEDIDGAEAAAGTAGSATPAPTPETGAEGEGGRWRWSGAGRTTTHGAAAEWGARSWTYDRDDGSGTAWSEGAGDRRRADAGAARPRPADPATWPSDAPPLPDLETLARRAAPLSLLALARRPDPRWRLAIALLGWPAVGFAVGSLLSMADGCASFSAACPEPLPLLPVAVQPFVIAGLFLLPTAAAVTAFASIVALTVALPVAAVLSVGTVPESRVGAPVLGVLSVVAYLAALAAASVVVWRARTGADVPGP